MAAPDVTLRDSADALFAPPLILTPVTPGAPTTPVEVRVYNDFALAGTDAAERLYVHVLARRKGTIPWLTTGLRALDESSLRVRTIGSTPGISAPNTGWVGLGRGEEFDLQDLPSGEGQFLGVSLLVPAQSDADVIEFALQVDRLISVFIGLEHADTVVNGLGDSATLVMVERDGTVSPSAIPDAFVSFPSVAYIWRGQLRSLPVDVAEFDNLDGAAQALGANEGYYSASTLGGDDKTLTKGLKNTLPLTDDDKPTIPGGELLWAWITRDDTGIIDFTEIDDVATLGLFFAVPSALSLVIGPGTAHAGGYRARTTTPQDVPLVANSTNDVFLIGPDSSFVVTTDSSVPDGRPLKLWTAVTDGAEVVTLEDHRVGVEVRGS